MIECDVCGKQIKSNAGLVMHMKTHKDILTLKAIAELRKDIKASKDAVHKHGLENQLRELL